VLVASDVGFVTDVMVGALVPFAPFTVNVSALLFAPDAFVTETLYAPLVTTCEP
jgi:hypothetical protein